LYQADRASSRDSSPPTAAPGRRHPHRGARGPVDQQIIYLNDATGIPASDDCNCTAQPKKYPVDSTSRLQSALQKRKLNAN
jgi:vacuolar-type H+-ATPase subunit B/Vma2